MKIEEPARSELPTTLFLVASVIVTVLVALFLAFSDDLQSGLPALIRPTIIVQSGSTATLSPTATPTPSNTPDGTAEPTSTPTATVVSIIAEAVCANVPEGWQPVMVGPGDTLYTLSIIYGATVGEIIQANCLEAGTVFGGMIVYLPVSPPTRLPCGPPQWWRSYVVRPGDTLYGLAIRHRTTVYAIMQANCLVESKIFAGRSLYLPPIPATVPPPPTIVLPSATPTATSTGTPSPTPTATTSGTASPTATTAAPTGTPTITTTPPASATPTPSSTATVNPTATVTPTAVPSATPTLPPTNTAEPTQAPTLPPTNTPQPTATDPPPTDTAQPN